MNETWTLSELVAEAAARLEALPPPKNGQVRAVPDERTIRYYATLGLLDRPASMRGRTALYERRHLAQVVAIKRMQSAGHSLADIQRMWATLDDVTLARMSGVQLVAGKPRGARKDFWKREAEPSVEAKPVADAKSAEPLRYMPAAPDPRQPHHTGSMPPATDPRQPHHTGSMRATPMTFAPPAGAVSLGAVPMTLAPPPSGAATITVPLAANVSIVIALPDDAAISVAPADVRALRAAAAPLVAELAKRGLIAHPEGTLEEP